MEFAERQVALFHTPHRNHTGRVRVEDADEAYSNHYKSEVFIPRKATKEEMKQHFGAFTTVNVNDIQFDADRRLREREHRLEAQDERAQRRVEKMKMKASVFSSAGKRKLMDMRGGSNKDNSEDDSNSGSEEDSEEEDGQSPSVQTFDGSLISLAPPVPLATLSATTSTNRLPGESRHCQHLVAANTCTPSAKPVQRPVQQ